jgi:hypothetical protein
MSVIPPHVSSTRVTTSRRGTPVAGGSIPKAIKSAISKETGIFFGLCQEGSLEAKSRPRLVPNRHPLPLSRRDRPPAACVIPTHAGAAPTITRETGWTIGSPLPPTRRLSGTTTLQVFFSAS